MTALAAMGPRKGAAGRRRSLPRRMPPAAQPISQTQLTSDVSPHARDIVTDRDGSHGG